MRFERLVCPPTGPLAELQRGLGNLFNLVSSGQIGLGRFLQREFPPVNVYDDIDALMVECELPGIDAQSLDLHVTADEIRIKGDRPGLMNQPAGTVHLQERGCGCFSRTVPLPWRVDNNNVQARFDNGVLWVRLPKLPQTRPQQVQVRAG